MCFNSSYEVVLIDIDRCESIRSLFHSSIANCMHRLQCVSLTTPFTNGSETDYFQLGWLIMWVLDEDHDYHSRIWETHSDEIKEDKFIQS